VSSRPRLRLDAVEVEWKGRLGAPPSFIAPGGLVRLPDRLKLAGEEILVASLTLPEPGGACMGEMDAGQDTGGRFGGSLRKTPKYSGDSGQTEARWSFRS
jgi:hypothetical protein